MADSLNDLAAKSAIADLVHRYAANIRHCRPEANAPLFIDDCWFEVREVDPLKPATSRVRSRSDGLAQVMKSIVISSNSARVFPAIHNLLITLDGDQAQASSLMIATVFPGGGELLGEYDDHFRREAGEWRFRSRCYTIYRESLTSQDPDL